MDLKFFGTKGYIEEKSLKHRMYSALKVEDVLFDLGENWKGRLDEINPKAIFITHAHPDHAFGLKNDIDLSVYASRDSFKQLSKKYNLKNLREIKPKEMISRGGLGIEAYKVDHSLRAPAVGYRVEGDRTIVYNPDVVYIHNREKVLKNVDLYIGDGSTLTRPMVRKKKGELYGHTPVRTQITWCKKFNIPKAVFVHFGKEAVEMDERNLKKKLAELGKERGVEVVAAYDGMEMSI